MAQKNIKWRIREYFFRNPTAQLRVRQIERAVGVPLPSVIRYVRELEREGMLQRSAVANVTIYAADRTSRAFLLEKRFSNIRALFASGLIEYLVQELSNPPIVVFGSFARGEDIEQSDIDLYIESPGEKLNCLPFEKKLGRSIQLFQHRSIHDIGNRQLANNIVNGVTLNGFLEVFR